MKKVVVHYLNYAGMVNSLIKYSGASGIVKRAELVGEHLHIEFEPELVDAIKEFNKVNFIFLFIFFLP